MKTKSEGGEEEEMTNVYVKEVVETHKTCDNCVLLSNHRTEREKKGKKGTTREKKVHAGKGRLTNKQTKASDVVPQERAHSDEILRAEIE
jgi:late competence protein required for DNA uptake (superfamily II DNA/RNA helicase)